MSAIHTTSQVLPPPAAPLIDSLITYLITYLITFLITGGEKPSKIKASQTYRS